MSDDNKKKRSPHLSTTPFIRAMMHLRPNEDSPLPTVHDLTKLLNTHTFNEATKEWIPNAEGVPNGTRNFKSVGSKLSQTRTQIEEKYAAKPEIRDAILSILMTDRSKDDDDDFDSIVSDIASLGLLRVPANMIQGGESIGTNGQPVGSEWTNV